MKKVAKILAQLLVAVMLCSNVINIGVLPALAEQSATVSGTVTGLVYNEGIDINYTYAGSVSGMVYGMAATGSGGFYSFAVPVGSDVTISAPAPVNGNGALPGNGYTLNNVTEDMPNNDFVYTHTVSGTLSGLLGANYNGLQVSYQVNDGPTLTVAVNPNGTYSIPNIPDGAKVVITPPLVRGYRVDKNNIVLPDLTANSGGNNFVYKWSSSGSSSDSVSSGGGDSSGLGQTPASTLPTPAVIEDNNESHIWYLRGYPDNSIRPDGKITRAEAAMVLYRLLTPAARDANSASTTLYADVNNNAWYGAAVATMSNLGNVKGYQNGYFRPGAPLTRAEMAAMLTRFYEPAGNHTASFSDVTANYWAYGAIADAYANGWITGDGNGTFRPNDTTTRAEFAAVINRVTHRKIDVSDIPGDIHVFNDLAVSHWGYADLIEASHSHDYTRKSSTGDDEIWSDITGTGIDAAYNQ